jgi:hypothetical protein
VIEVRILPEVMEWARCACEAARRGLLRVSEVENLVDDHLRFVARQVWPDPQLSDSFVREAVEWIAASTQWRDDYLKMRQKVAEQLSAPVGKAWVPPPVSVDLKNQRRGWLKEFRDQHGLNVETMGEQIGISARVVQAIAAEESARFKPHHQEKLLKLIGVSRQKWYGADDT